MARQSLSVSAVCSGHLANVKEAISQFTYVHSVATKKYGHHANILGNYIISMPRANKHEMDQKTLATGL